jgi:hypothetical protein
LHFPFWRGLETVWPLMDDVVSGMSAVYFAAAFESSVAIDWQLAAMACHFADCVPNRRVFDGTPLRESALAVIGG